MKNLRATEVRTSSFNESSELNRSANHVQGNLMKRCMSTEEWTDEKHSMYLESMEASFVNQLYDFKQMLGWCSPKVTSSRSTPTTSGQMKNVQGRCRKMIKFGRENPQIRRSNEFDNLKANPWIQQMRCSSNHHDMFFSHIEMSDQNFVDEEGECQNEKAKRFNL